MIGQRTIGRCSLCHGPVQVPELWHAVVPPTPRCTSCGAVPAGSGPVIPMERPAGEPRTWTMTGTLSDAPLIK